jgi:hypothetical protein
LIPFLNYVAYNSGSWQLLVCFPARSPVFLKMLCNDMTEKKDGNLIISDISTEAMQLLLKYVYSGITNEWTFSRNNKWTDCVEEMVYVSEKVWSNYKLIYWISSLLS